MLSILLLLCWLLSINAFFEWFNQRMWSNQRIKLCDIKKKKEYSNFHLVFPWINPWRSACFSRTFKSVLSITYRSSCPEVFCKKDVLTNFATFTAKDLCQMFPCEFCEISRNTFFYGTPPVAASILILQSSFLQCLLIKLSGYWQNYFVLFGRDVFSFDFWISYVIKISFVIKIFLCLDEYLFPNGLEDLCFF